METLKATWFGYGTEDHELLRELLDDESHFFLFPEETMESQPAGLMDEQSANQPEETKGSRPEGLTDEQSINQLISTVYSGPTIHDIENALSVTSGNYQSQSFSQARIPMLDRGMSKIDNNKYTLKLKSCGNGMMDDGYKWRKYGQKSIKNSPYPRSYYRCTNSRCNAKKQVERSSEDHDTLIITYEGLHLHFAYPYFLVKEPEDGNLPTKKPKRTVSEAEESRPNETQQTTEHAQEGLAQVTTMSPLPNRPDDHHINDSSSNWAMGHQGLLEDVVPFMVRNPSNYCVSSNSSSYLSYRSPSASPSSLSWSPNSSHIQV